MKAAIYQLAQSDEALSRICRLPEAQSEIMVSAGHTGTLSCLETVVEVIRTSNQL